jgi:hypothetical protein
MKRTVVAISLLSIISACHREVPVNKPGWRFGMSGRGPHVSYNFGDYRKATLPAPQAEETVFAGTCDLTPIFLVIGGDYHLRATQFTLSVDGTSWNLKIFNGVDAPRALYMDDPVVVAALREAKERITFDVDGWHRELEPSPLIRKFVDECEAKRRAPS